MPKNPRNRASRSTSKSQRFHPEPHHQQRRLIYPPRKVLALQEDTIRPVGVIISRPSRCKKRDVLKAPRINGFHEIAKAVGGTGLHSQITNICTRSDILRAASERPAIPS